MDWSYLVKDLVQSAQTDKANTVADQALTDPASYKAGAITSLGFGGDLYMFPSSSSPAQPINTHGLGNYLNYGLRNIIPNGKGLYIGMANPMNLRTDPTDKIPEGGWELIEMKKGG
jgi:hypothetical protein